MVASCGGAKLYLRALASEDGQSLFSIRPPEWTWKVSEISFFETQDLKFLIINVVEEASKRNVQLNLDGITLALSNLRKRTKFPPIRFEETKHGVYSTEVARALSMLQRTNELKCERTCQLTELGKLSWRSMEGLLSSKLDAFGVSIGEYKSALDTTIKDLPLDVTTS